MYAKYVCRCLHKTEDVSCPNAGVTGKDFLANIGARNQTQFLQENSKHLSPVSPDS